MKAPDKIYLDHKIVANSEITFIEAIVPEFRAEKNDIEYIRKDAFIEKAREFLSKESNIPLWDDRGGNFGCDTPKLVENFIKYMKGE